MCLEHCTRHDVCIRRENINPKAYGISVINTPTQSKELVNLLNAVGHCVSYDMIRNMDTSIAENQ